MRSDEKYYAAIEAISVLERNTLAVRGSQLRRGKCRKLYSCLASTKGIVDEDRFCDFARRLAERSSKSGEMEFALKFIKTIPEAKLTAADREILVDALLSTGKTEEAGQMLHAESWKDAPAAHFRLLGKMKSMTGDEAGAKEAFRNAIRVGSADDGAIEALLALSMTHSDEMEFLRLKADNLQQTARAKESLKIYRKLLRLDSGSPGILKSAGIALADLKKPEKAEKLLLRSLAGREDIETEIALGLVELQEGKYDDSYRRLSHAVDEGARGFDLLSSLCRTCILTGKEERGIEALEMMKDQHVDDGTRALTEVNRLTALAGSRNHHNFVVSSAGVAEHYGVPPPEILEIHLRSFLALSKHREALSCLDRHAGLSEQFPQIRMVALRESGSLEEAEKIADNILSTDASDDESLNTKMQAMFFRKMGKEGIDAYSRRVLARGGAAALSTLLEIAKAEGNDRLVLNASQALISMDCRELNVLDDRATALERMGRLKQGEKCYRQMYARLGTVEALELLSSFCARHGMIGKEEQLLSDAVERGLQVPTGLVYRLAKIRMEKGDPAGSLNAIETSLSNRETPEGRYLQSEVLLGLSRPDEAIEAARKAMNLGYPAKLAEVKVAEAFMLQGRNEEGLQHYNRAIGFGSRDVNVYIGKARLLQSMGRGGEASSEIEAIEKMFGDSTAAHEECAAFYYHAGHYQRCITACEAIIRKDRKNFTAWKMRGLSLIALKNYDEGVKSLDSCPAEKKDMEILEALKSAHAARNDAVSVVKTIDMMIGGKGASRELLLEKGQMLQRSGRHDEALSTFQEAINDFGRDEKSVTGKAGVLHRQGRYAEELKLLLEFLEGGQDAPEVLAMVAEVYSEMKRYGDALDYADRAMQSDPASVAIVDLRARILMKMERHNEAERTIDIALELSPKDPEALELKGNLLMIDGGHAQALEIFNGALAAGICSASIYKNRGDCLLQAGRYVEALDSYNKASKLEPGRTDTLLGRGICEYNLERYSSATMCLNELTKKEPDNASGWYYFGLSLAKQRLSSESRKAFEEAVRLEDTHGRAWYELGRIHLEEGNLEASRTALSKSLELNPENPEAREKLDLCVAAGRRVRAEDNARAIMKLEYEMGRVPTREEAFAMCKIPLDEIDEALEAIQEPTSLTVPTAGDGGWEALEERSAAVLQKCFRSDEGMSSGIRLCDIAVGFPSYTFDECKQLLEYIRKVQQMGMLEGVEDKRFEKLMKKATKLKAEDRTLAGIVKNLGVGIYTARLVQGSLAAMGRTGYHTDYVNVSPPVVDAPKEDYDPYEARRELMEQYYGPKDMEEALPEPDDEKCLYHGREAMGECSVCQTNICDDCLSGTGGSCPNCGVLLNGEESSGDAVQ